jgi:hypothetical protein
MLDREREGREQNPTAAVVDSQSIKAPAAERRGFDAGKIVIGRKRHIAVDTDGRLLMLNLTTADISDRAGAQAIVAAVRKRWPWLEHLFADGAYDRTRQHFEHSGRRLALDRDATVATSITRRQARDIPTVNHFWIFLPAVFWFAQRCRRCFSWVRFTALAVLHGGPIGFVVLTGVIEGIERRGSAD